MSRDDYSVIALACYMAGSILFLIGSAVSLWSQLKGKP